MTTDSTSDRSDRKAAVKFNKMALAACLRSDLTAFIRKVFDTVSPGDDYHHNWHIEAIVHELIRCRAGQCQRLLITQPPRSLKSICTSVAFVAWALGHDPKLRFICVSYSDDLAKDLSRLFRMVIESRWYRNLFPKMRLKKETDSECITTQGGGRLATSIGGTLTGRGADIIIIDDPLKAKEARQKTSRDNVNHWYSTTLVTRLNDKQNGAIIIVMQRLHQDDLAGFVLAQEDWRHLDLPAIAIEDQKIAIGPGLVHHRNKGDVLHPKHESLETLKRMEARIGNLTFSAQYQQRPIPATGNVIRREWLKTYEWPPDPGANPRIIQSWDIATTVNLHSHYSVCTTWAVDGKTYYLIDVWRGKLDFPELKRKVISLAKIHDANTILIEKAGPGLPLFQELCNDTTPGVPSPIGIVPDTDKETRMIAQSSRFEAGQVLLPESAPWRAEFLIELLGFPNTKHDDQVDSVSQFLRWITQTERRGKAAIGRPKIFVGGVCVSEPENTSY